MTEANGNQEGSDAEAPSQFAVGDKVEVCSTAAPGHPPVWYEATVVRKVPRTERYVVEYGSRPVASSPGGNSSAAKKKKKQQQSLRKTFDLSDMRPVRDTPRPPPPTKPRANGRSPPAFRVGDAVEAYHKEGWWAGCVVGEAAGGSGRKCQVKLLSCAGEGEKEEEELKFPPDQLRNRLDWIDGQWVTPSVQHKVMKEQDQPAPATSEPGLDSFKEGELVEVSSDEEGFAGAWFLAILISRTGTGPSNTFLVEYCDLRTDDGKDLLREEVDAAHIRPLPPNNTDATAAPSFKLLEEVDAWSNDGWWVGVVSKIRQGPRYAVYFRQSDEELEFAGHEIRPHWDWIKGKWIRVSLDSMVA